MYLCKILAPGLIKNPNGSLYCDYVVGQSPLTGDEPVLRKAWASRDQLIENITSFEASLIDGEAFIFLALAQPFKQDPTLAVPSAFADASASVSLTEPSAPIHFG